MYIRHQESYPKKSHPKDYTGQRYGELVAIKSLDKKETTGESILWLLECNCGRYIESVPAKLKTRIEQGEITRCLECNPVKRLPRGMAASNEVLRQYKQTARKNGRQFLLSGEEARQLFQSDCFYCGSPPSNYKSPGRWKYNGGYHYNGIDRLNNEKDYTTDNCVPCCVMCNKAKRDVPVDMFITWIWRAVEHLKNNTQAYGVGV